MFYIFRQSKRSGIGLVIFLLLLLLVEHMGLTLKISPYKILTFFTIKKNKKNLQTKGWEKID